MRGVTVTTISTVAGLLAGLGSALVASGPKDTIGLTIVVVAFVAQLPVFHLLGIDVREFSTKDNLYVAFMTFVFWFISWGLLLTTSAFQ
jgi:hypothetical protein